MNHVCYRDSYLFRLMTVKLQFHKSSKNPLDADWYIDEILIFVTSTIILYHRRRLRCVHRGVAVYMLRVRPCIVVVEDWQTRQKRGVTALQSAGFTGK